MAYIEISHLNPLNFVNKSRTLLPNYHMKHMDTWLPQEQKLYLQGGKCVYQKWQNNDIIFLQVMADVDPIRLKVINNSGAVIDSFLMSFIIQVNGVRYYQAQVALTTYGQGYFKVEMHVGDPVHVIYESNTFHVLEDHPRTVLMKYSHNSNGLILWQTGIYFLFRIDGVVADFVPKVKRTTYISQTQNAKTVKGDTWREFKLFIGNIVGVPDWMPDRVNEISVQNNWDIDGKPFAAKPGAELQPKRDQRYAWGQWELEIQEAVNRRSKRFDGDGLLQDQKVVIDYTVEGALFGPIAGSANDNTYVIGELG